MLKNTSFEGFYNPSFSSRDDAIEYLRQTRVRMLRPIAVEHGIAWNVGYGDDEYEIAHFDANVIRKIADAVIALNGQIVENPVVKLVILEAPQQPKPIHLETETPTTKVSIHHDPKAVDPRPRLLEILTFSQFWISKPRRSRQTTACVIQMTIHLPGIEL